MFSKIPTKLKLILFVVGVIFLLIAPFIMSDFRLSLLGKFAAFAILALGIDLIWGYTGILSLGHGVFFGLGAYCMAMHLKLVASGDSLPDFMSWSGVETLPWFWQLFHSPIVAFLLALLIPALIASILGFLTFRNRIKGAFFSILSQALVIITVTLFIGQQGYTGGTNGLTNFDTFLGFDLGSQSTKITLYFITIAVMFGMYFLCRKLISSRFGNILVAIRDGENRVRFTGYNPVTYKVFVYCLSASLAGLAGVLFVLQEGIISPAQMGIIPSIEMVLWVAIGGRATLIGAIVGAIVTNQAKTFFSESFPDGWLLFMGATFIASVLIFPKGIMGLIDKVQEMILKRWKRGNHDEPTVVSVDSGNP
jgi:urea transport system permease protein